MRCNLRLKINNPLPAQTHVVLRTRHFTEIIIKSSSTVPANFRIMVLATLT